MASLPLALAQPQPLKRPPYLVADDSRRARWRALLPPGFKAGLVWAGNPGHEQDRRRSLRAAEMLPLLQTPGVSFYRVDPGTNGGDLQPLLDAGLIDFTAQIADFADTAALLAELDLIVTVDTAMAHLAGALGRPVWTMISKVPDWRWGLDRDSTDWYPTMRLFRQEKAWDWSGVLARVAEELGVLACERRDH